MTGLHQFQKENRLIGPDTRIYRSCWHEIETHTLVSSNTQTTAMTSRNRRDVAICLGDIIE